MSSTEAYNFVLSGLGCLAIAVSSLVIGLSLSKRTVELSTYRFFILNFALFDLLSSLVCLLTQLKIVPARGLLMGSMTGVLRVLPRAAPACMGISVGLETMSFFVMPLNYVYRLAAVHNQLERFVSPRVLVPAFIVCVGEMAFFIWVINALSLPEEETRRRFQLNNPQVNFDSIQGQKFGFPPMDETWMFNLPAWAVRLNWGFAFSVVFFCIWKIETALKRLRENMSETTYALHRQLLLALIIQAILPLLLMVVPLQLFWNALMGDIDLIYGEISVIFIYAYPLTNTLTTVIFVKPYRKAVFSFFRPLLGQSVLSVVDASSRPSAQATTSISRLTVNSNERRV